MLYFYRFLQLILIPFVICGLLLRAFLGKEDKKRFAERLGVASLTKDNSKKLIWIHCASVGESLSVLPIIKRLVRLKNTQVLITTGTATSAKLMAEKLPKNAFHQYVPIDYLFAVKRFVKHWNPDISVFVESDLWPNLLSVAPNKVLINARMSDRSFKRYSKLKPVAKVLLNGFDTIFTQSNQDFARFSSLSSTKVVNSGNIKNDGPALDYNKNEFNVLTQAFVGRNILVVASTHKGEDEQVIELYNKLKKQYAGLLMILVPRHPHRGSDIASLLENAKLNYIQRSKTKGLERANTLDVYLADTLGEIGLWYALADVVLMGGSLVQWGGHNPLEPLKAGKPTYSGFCMNNFKNMSEDLIAKDVFKMCQTNEELFNTLNNALNDKEFLESFPIKAKEAIDSMSGATDIVVEAIKDKIKSKKDSK
jgi:3-deoxy-D-manno-octulosonic-acid transferase